MAYLVITGEGSRVTSERLRTPEISAAVLNLRNTLIKGGAKVVRTWIGAAGAEIDWLPAGADLDLEPIRSSILLPETVNTSALAVLDDEEEIPVALDIEEPSKVVSLADWITRRDL